MDRRIEPSETDEDQVKEPEYTDVPVSPPARRRISTELPARNHPRDSRPPLIRSRYQQDPDLAAPPQHGIEVQLPAHRQNRQPPPRLASDLSYRSEDSTNLAGSPLRPATPPLPTAPKQRQDVLAPPTARSRANAPGKKRRILIPLFGVLILAGLFFSYTRLTSSGQNSALSDQAPGTASPASATASTLETEIVDLDEVAEEDTLRLEIPLDANEATVDSDLEVDSSLPPLKFTIAEGQVLLTGTAQSEEQATAMIDQASDVFAGVELVSDYQVNPRAPSPVSGVVVQKPVVFATGSAVIRPEYYPVLDACADVLKSQPSLVMTVAGHTDNVGSPELNLALAEQRAQAVVDYYVSSGLDQSKFERVSLGDLEPITTNDTEEGRQANRRTDLEFEGIFKDVIAATQE